MDPPPSFACPAVTIPPMTAADEPPDEPPVECVVRHGLWAGPNNTDSVTGAFPISGVLVFPRIKSPAALNRFVSSLSFVAMTSANNRLPFVDGSPATSQLRSLTRNGTPAIGDVDETLVASARAPSYRFATTALRVGLRVSIREIDASTSSTLLTSPAATSDARPTVSFSSRSRSKSDIATPGIRHNG